MLNTFIISLTKTQYMIFLTGVIVLSIFGVDYLADLAMPHSRIPFGPISMLLMVVPITRIRKNGRPEEFKPYTLKRFLVTATLLVGFALLVLVASDYIMLGLIK